MIQRMMTSALFAGFAAGLFAALLHFAFVQKMIVLGEAYETGAAVHHAGGAPTGPDGHPTEMAATGAAGVAVASDGQSQGDGAGDAVGPLLRNALTVLFQTLLYCSYALILVAGFALAQRRGQRVTARDGLLWGIAGFVAVQLAPAMGLAPELPGTMAAPLMDRQIWWAGTALCSGAALVMIGYGRRLGWLAAAVVLLALPHIIGAPEPDGFSGVAPPELAAAFAARSLGSGLAAWSLMGWLSGWLWDRAPA